MMNSKIVVKISLTKWSKKVTLLSGWVINNFVSRTKTSAEITESLCLDIAKRTLKSVPETPRYQHQLQHNVKYK